MAGRPYKEGLDFFPVDTDIENDEKIQTLITEHPNRGLEVFIRLLSRIYKQHGYFMEWTPKRQKNTSAGINVDINSLNAITNTCFEEGLFSNRMFQQFNILTSKSIQVRYLVATHRRKKVLLIPDFMLLPTEEILECNKKSHFLNYVDINSIYDNGIIVIDNIISLQTTFPSISISNKEDSNIKKIDNSDTLRKEGGMGETNFQQIQPAELKPATKEPRMSMLTGPKWEEAKLEFLANDEFKYNNMRYYALNEQQWGEYTLLFFEWLGMSNDQKTATLMYRHFPNWLGRKEYYKSEIEKRKSQGSSATNLDDTDYSTQNKW